MALETGTFINSLVATNPAATDALAAADDHMRLIKSTIKNTFPNITGAVNLTQAEANIIDGGTSATSTTLVNADRLVVNDDGTMKQVALSDMLTYLGSNLSVTSSMLTDATIATADIADNAITNALMADDSVGAAELIDNSVGADALNIDGNGTSGQYLVSDGDGSFSYNTLTIASPQGVIGSHGTATGAGSNTITSVSITPTSASSKILLLASASFSSNDSDVTIELVRDSTALVGSLQRQDMNEKKGDGADVGNAGSLSTMWLDTPNTTSSVTYYLKSDRTTSHMSSRNAVIIAIELV